MGYLRRGQDPLGAFCLPNHKHHSVSTHFPFPPISCRHLSMQFLFFNSHRFWIHLHFSDFPDMLSNHFDSNSRLTHPRRAAFFCYRVSGRLGCRQPSPFSLPTFTLHLPSRGRVVHAIRAVRPFFLFQPSKDNVFATQFGTVPLFPNRNRMSLIADVVVLVVLLGLLHRGNCPSHRR